MYAEIQKRIKVINICIYYGRMINSTYLYTIIKLDFTVSILGYIIYFLNIFYL